MSIIFALKLALVPSLIGGVTLAGRRWGPAMAGWLSAFPVVAGPVLFFIAMDQGIGFAASAATGTLSAVLAILVFNISYAWAATRYRWQLCLVLAFVAYALAVLGLKLWAPSLAFGAVAVLAALLVAQRLFPHAETVNAVSVQSSDMHWRMLAGAVLVLAVTGLSARLGPQLSGVLAMFPVMASVLVAFSHRHSGPSFAIKLLRGTVTGYYAFAVFCMALALSLPLVGIATAFLASLSGAVVVQAISRIYLQRR
jgi:hypothetical protein